MRNKKLFFVLLLSVLFFNEMTAVEDQQCHFEKVIIWGHKLHTHTHSYIHKGFFDAFERLGYDVYWFDNRDDVSAFDFSNSLFLSEGSVDGGIPLRPDCYYLIHNPSSGKYNSLNIAYFQVYTDDVLALSDLVQIDTCIYYGFSQKCVFMPWATDLFPEEIELMKKKIPLPRPSRHIHWIGTLSTRGVFNNLHALGPFILAGIECGFTFIPLNPSGTGISVEDHVHFIQSSYMAPAIVGDWQREKGYIPCRLFKNISYGQMGITNSKSAYDLFEGKIVYNPDTYQLFYDAFQRISTLKVEEQRELMDIVKNKHTYLNRVDILLQFLDAIYGSSMGCNQLR